MIILQRWGGQRWPRRWVRLRRANLDNRQVRTAGLESGGLVISSGGYWGCLHRWWRVWASRSIGDGDQDISEERISFNEMITMMRLKKNGGRWWSWRRWSQLWLICGCSRWLQSVLRSTWICICDWSISQLDFNICHIEGGYARLPWCSSQTSFCGEVRFGICLSNNTGKF